MAKFISAEEGYVLSRLPQYQGVAVAHPDGGVTRVSKRQAAAIKASRGTQKRGLLERLAQAGVSRDLAAQVAAAEAATGITMDADTMANIACRQQDRG